MENKKIDFNLIIGFLLIGLLLYLMNNSLMNNSTEKEISPDQIESVEVNSDKKKLDKLEYGDLDVILNDKEKESKEVLEEESITSKPETVTLSSEKVSLTFSDSCACFIDASIIEEDSNGKFKYEYTDGVAVKLIKHRDKDQSPLQFNLKDNQFKMLASPDTDSLKVTYQHISSGIELVYQLNGDKLGLLINNISDNELSVDWRVKGPRQEKNLNSGWTSERTQSDLYYANFDGGYDYISEPDDPENEEDVSWIAYKQQFFSTIL